MARHITTLVFLLSSIATGAGAQPPPRDAKIRSLDLAYRQLDDAYPSSRAIGGTISIITGAAVGFGGFFLMIDTSRPTDEGIVGAIGMCAGIATGVDGIVRAFGRSSAEALIPHYEHFPAGKPAEYGGLKDKAQYGEEQLSLMMSESRTSRWLRAGLDLVAAGSYFYLYTKKDGGKWAYQYLLGPAIASAAIGVYRILRGSPEERAWAKYEEALQHGGRAANEPTLELAAGLTPEGGPYLGAVLSF